MIWVCVALAVIFVADAVRLRARVRRLPVIPAGGGADGFDAVTGPGVSVPPDALRAAAAFADAERLDVVDLVPADLATADALALLMIVDPAVYREARFRPGVTAGQALAVRRSVRERSGIPAGAAADPVALARDAQRHRKCAPARTDRAISTGLRARPLEPGWRRAVMQAVVGGSARWLLLGPPIVLGLLVWAAIASPAVGVPTLALYHIQPWLIFRGQALCPADLGPACALRVGWEAWLWLRTVLAPSRTPRPTGDPVEALRPTYDALLRDGLDRFFEPRRETCPVCDGRELACHLEVPDLFQQKPGRFRLDACAACGHIFQNPRLSLEGLGFYYRDFYDGLGEGPLEALFGASGQPYLARARLLDLRAAPKAWLDVGGGHGHFCCAAREVWPETRFDALDLSESVDEAVALGWVDHGYRGLLPDLAGEIGPTYDVVSMSHYLEHTREPAEELAAARTVLRPGGHLLIEVPDPDCRMGGLLGRYWLPWFQPQHQHFLSVRNLERLLNAEGFRLVVTHRGEAHQTVDLMFASFLVLHQLAPVTRGPWLSPLTAGHRLWRATVFGVGMPLLFLGIAADALLQKALRRPGWSNTYRVLARLEAAPEGGAVDASGGAEPA